MNIKYFFFFFFFFFKYLYIYLETQMDVFFWLNGFDQKKWLYGFFRLFFNILSKKYGFRTAKYGPWLKKYSHTAKYWQIRAFDQKKMAVRDSRYLFNLMYIFLFILFIYIYFL